MNRRDFLGLAAVYGAAALGRIAAGAAGKPFRLNYILASSMYGRLPLAEVLRQAAKTGAEHIDIWPERHANHREQIEAMGHRQFAEMLQRHEVKLGILTHYDLGPFNLQSEMRVLKEFGGSMLICGSGGPRGLRGAAQKAAIEQFVEKMRPHLAVAEDLGVTIGIENHAGSLLDSPDAVRWFAELGGSRRLGVALAPYHLPQDAGAIGDLIIELGERLVHFYAWQHGMGCHKKLPKQQELLQLPGRGSLDFVPIVASLRKIGYRGWTEVFMHPVPRGIPIMPTADEVTEQIIRARRYLQVCTDKANTEAMD